MGLERDCLLGRKKRTKTRGRQRIKFMDVLLDYVGDGWTVVDLVRLDEDRERRHSMVTYVT